LKGKDYKYLSLLGPQPGYTVDVIIRKENNLTIFGIQGKEDVKSIEWRGTPSTVQS
jgi:hypothetical protein